MLNRNIFRISLLFAAMAFSASLAYSQSIARSDDRYSHFASSNLIARSEFRFLASRPSLTNPFASRSPTAPSLKLTAMAISGFPTITGNDTPGKLPFVRSLNTLKGDLSLVEGANITITPGDNTLTINASGLLGSVAHDATLVGDGTAGMPLGVVVPLMLSEDDSDPTISGINLAGPGLFGSSSDKEGVRGESIFGPGVSGTSLNSDGVRGFSDSGFGVFGESPSGTGVRGLSSSGDGVTGFSDSGRGVGGGSNSGRGVSGGSGRGIGVSGTSPSGTGVRGASESGLAGDFFGHVDISGTLTKGGGSFKIDHPLDPGNKYLYHSFVESPDMMNVYNGNITTDLNGEAIVILPQWFEALNKDFRYQLTVIGQFAQAIVAEKIRDNRFTIKTDYPSVEVSWQVTGIRKDQWAEKNRIPVEVNKPEKERGYYLHPKAFDMPEEKDVEWIRNPEMMKQMKQMKQKIERGNDR